jgi:hypothetical protein
MLVGTTKKGILAPDADGYYRVVLGAYGAYNSVNMFYDLDSAKLLFQSGSPLMRMLEKGVLRGEYKHPEMERGMTEAEYIRRIRQIDADRVSHHIRKVWLEGGHSDEKGRPVTLVMGEVKPDTECEHGRRLKAALDNPHENVYFSVRSLTMDDMMRGIKYTREIVTWDYVNEGGIYSANKYNSPSLESFTEVRLTQEMVYQAVAMEPKAVGMESADTTWRGLIQEMGWELSPCNAPEVPNYTQW